MSTRTNNKTESKLSKLRRLAKNEEEKEKEAVKAQHKKVKELAVAYRPRPNKTQRQIENMKRKITITQHMMNDIQTMQREHDKLRKGPASRETKARAERIMWDLHQMRGDMLLLERPDYVVPAPGESVVVVGGGGKDDLNLGGVDIDSAANTINGYLNQAHAILNQLQTLNTQVLQGMHSVESVIPQNKAAVQQIVSAAKSATNGILGIAKEMAASRSD